MFAVVTGGFGFIGSYVCELLSQRGWKFVVIDRETPAAVNVEFVRALPGLLWCSGADVADLDFAEASGLSTSSKSSEGVDAVFHLAAETHVDRSLGLDPTTLHALATDPLERLYRTNVIGTARVAEFARGVGARLVHWSTDEVYGDCLTETEPPSLARENPIGYSRRCDESDVLEPSSPYAASKAASEMVVSASARLGLRAAVLRPSNAYGPRQARDKLIPVAVGHLSQGRPVPLYDGGWQVRQWVHAQDIARAALMAVDMQAEGTWNVGGPSLLQNSRLCTLLARAGGVPHGVESVPDRPGHDAAYAVSSAQIKNDLGWVPFRSIEEDAAEVFAAYAG